MIRLLALCVFLCAVGQPSASDDHCSAGFRSYTSARSPLRIAVAITSHNAGDVENKSIMQVGEGHFCVDKINGYLAEVDEVMYFVPSLGVSPVESSLQCAQAVAHECQLAGLSGDAPIQDAAILRSVSGWLTCKATCPDGKSHVRLVDARVRKEEQ